MPRIRCRVVCGFGLTMLIFSPTSGCSSVDLPTFGRRTIATNPERVFAPSSSEISRLPAPDVESGPASFFAVTRQLHEHRCGRFLLRKASAPPPADSPHVPFVDLADDGEGLLVLAAANRLDPVHR